MSEQHRKHAGIRPAHNILGPKLTRRVKRHMRLLELYCRACQRFHGRLADFGIGSIEQWQAVLLRQAKWLDAQPAVLEAREALDQECMAGVEEVQRRGEPFPVYLTLCYGNSYHRRELDAVAARLHESVVIQHAMGLTRSFVTTRRDLTMAITPWSAEDFQVSNEELYPGLFCFRAGFSYGDLRLQPVCRRSDGGLEIGTLVPARESQPA